MKKSEVLAHFNGNQSAVAAYLNISPSAVNQWPDIVPKERALELHVGLGLPYDPDVYRREASASVQ